MRRILGTPAALGPWIPRPSCWWHGAKAVWKLMNLRGAESADVPVPGTVPPDVDTWQDYELAVAASC